VNRLLSLFGSLLFHLFFGAALFGGIVGVIFCVREWRKAANDDVGGLAAIGLLTICLAVVGFLGIWRFRNSSQRELDAESDLAPFRSQKAISNCISGAFGLLAGIGSVVVQLRSPGTADGAIVQSPIVLICVGLVQFAFGIWQLVHRKRPEFDKRVIQ
jgi:hypothetical protein